MINIQARKITDDLASLVKQIDSLVDNPAEKSADTKHAFFVLITDDAEPAEARLQDFASNYNISNTPLTVFDGIAGPSGYNIAKDAEVTVMMWTAKDKAVQYNHAFGAGELDEKAVQQIVADAKEHLK